MSKIYCLGLLFIFLFGCSSDFNPNASWQETMLVYGLMDSGDDSTKVRIQKCFLGEGDMMEYAKILDSNTYNPDELEVFISEYEVVVSGGRKRKGEFTGKTIPLLYYMMDNKKQGDFFHPYIPVYQAVTNDFFLPGKFYEIEVNNVKTGNKVIARAIPIEEGIYIKGNSSQSGGFWFENAIKGDRFHKLQWSTQPSAVGYQPVFRFYYIVKETNEEKFVDYSPDMQIQNSSSSEMSFLFYQSNFGAFIKGALSKYPKSSLVFVDKFTIFLAAADEGLTNYIRLNKVSTGLIQEKPIFTNVEGGLGVFAFRKTHISTTYQYKSSTIDYIIGLGNWF